MTEEASADTPKWMQELEAKRERRLKVKLGHETGAGSPCLHCKDACPGLDLHFWRKICKNCKCGKESHDVQDDDIFGFAQFQLLGSKPNKPNKIVLPGKKDAIELEWTPKGQKEVVEKYLKTLPPELLPVKGSAAAQERKQLLQKQIPLHDIDPSLCDSLTENEIKEMNDYVSNIKENIVGIGQIVQLNLNKGIIKDRNIIKEKINKNYALSENKSTKYATSSPLQLPNLKQLNLENEKYPENTKNLPIFIPHRITQKNDEVFPVFPKMQEKIFPFGSNLIKEKFLAPTPYKRLPFTPNSKVENSFPVGGSQPKFATVLNPNYRTIDDVNRLPLGFREQMCIVAPNGERLPVCTNNKYYQGPNGEKVVQSPNGERFYVDPDDGRYAVEPHGERLLIGAHGEKYYEDPEDSRFVFGPNREKCFVPKEKFNLNSKGERYQEDPNGEVFFAEPDNDRYVTDETGKRYIVAPNGVRYPVDVEDGRLATDKNQKFLIGPKNEKYIQDPMDKNILVGPNGEQYIFPKDRYITSLDGERYLNGPNNQKYFADPNDDRYCVGPRGQRYHVASDGTLYRIDDSDGRFLMDPKTGDSLMMGPRGRLFHRDVKNPNYVVGENGDKHFIGEDIFDSEPNGVRYLKGPNGMKYFADPIQERRAVGPNGEKYLIGPNGELYPVDPKDKRFGRDGLGNKICLGPNAEIFYSDPKDDRFVVAPDGLKYFVPKNYFNTTPDGEKILTDINDQVYKVDPKDDRYALGPKNERFLIGHDGGIYPLDKNDGRFGVTQENEKIFFDPKGKMYRKDSNDDNCAIAPDGEKYYLPMDRYKTAPTGERYILNQNKERCIPSQDNDNFAINPKGRRYFVTPKGEAYPVNTKDGRFLDDKGKKFISGPNGEKYYQDVNPNYVVGPNNQKVYVPKDKYLTSSNGERYLENPYGQKYYPSNKDDNFLIGPNGEKTFLDPTTGEIHKVAPDDARFLQDANGNKFLLSDNQKLYHQPNGALKDIKGNEYKVPKDRYKTAANGERFLQGNRGELYFPDPIDDNYAIGENGERYLVDPQGNLHPVDTEDGRFAQAPNGERFLMDADGNLYHLDPYDHNCVIGPQKDKYFLPNDKFITSPDGERFLRGPNGEKYVPHPTNDSLAIGPDGKPYFVNKNKEVQPLESINPTIEEVYPAESYDRFIIGPDKEYYRLDPEDMRYCTSPNGERYLLGQNKALYPVDKNDGRFGVSPQGHRFIMGPNYEKYYEDPSNRGYVIGPDGMQYLVAGEAHTPTIRSPWAEKKDSRFFTDPHGNHYVETTTGQKYPVNIEDENFVQDLDGKNYMLPPNNEDYIVGPGGQKQQLKVPKDHLIRDSKYPSGRPTSDEYDPINVLKAKPPGNKLPPGTTADKTPKKYVPEHWDIYEENLEPSKVNIGGIRDLEETLRPDKKPEILDLSDQTKTENVECHRCKKPFEKDSIVVQIDRSNAKYHSDCFRCYGCNQHLADLLYFYDKESDQVYCGRDFAKIRGIPRCVACDELIFVKEYCLAENATFHIKHFCCYECDSPLAGSNYIMEEQQPICLSCYETLKASKCSACMRIIQPDERGAQLQELHFHATDECFCCRTCRKPLLGAKLLLRKQRLYCSGVCFNRDQ